VRAAIGPPYDPRFTNADPRFINADPRFVDVDPRFVDVDPRVVHHDPRIIDDDPRVVHHDPRVIDDDPRFVDAAPRPCSLGPHVGTLRRGPVRFEHGWRMRLMQVAQRAVDLDRAAAFYSDLLGAAPTARFDPPGLLFYDLGGVRLLLDRSAPSAFIYLLVDDIDRVLERLRRAGVTVVDDPHVIFTHRDDTLGPAGSDEYMAFVRDSEGNLLGLVEHRRPTRASQDPGSRTQSGA
jgi:methylmalonyl-CoA/ethylmalonyl-CoA epimerase